MHYGSVSTLIYFMLLPHLSHGTTKEGLEKHVFRYPTTWPRFVRYVSVEGSILQKTRSCQLAVATPDMTMICSILSNFYIKRQLMYEHRISIHVLETTEQLVLSVFEG